MSTAPLRAAFVNAAALAGQCRALQASPHLCAAGLRCGRQPVTPRRRSSIAATGFATRFASSSASPFTSTFASTPTHSSAAPTPANAPRTAPRASGATLLRDDVLDVDSPGGPVPVRLCVESLAPRRLRVSGSVRVDAALARVWRVLTAYPLQSAFIPNLISTTPQRRDGRLYLEQVGLLSRKLRLRSTVVLAVTEDLGARTIRLSRDSGRDFVEFDAVYALRDLGDAETEAGADTADVVPGDGDIVIDYTVVASPFSLYPMSLVEGKIVKEVPRMLAAVRQEAMVPTHVPCDDVAPAKAG